jgi:hypothetical protein
MSKRYESFFVRSFPNDINEYPKPPGSPIWASPDIIPYGANVCADPRKAFLGENFNKVYTDNLLYGQLNYLYVRGKNFAKKEVECKLCLHWSHSTLLLTPGTWKRNSIEGSTGHREKPGDYEYSYIPLTVKPDQECVCSNDNGGVFIWKPNSLPEPNSHYCLISRAISDGYPAEIPNPKDIDTFALFLHTEKAMGYAQRNVRLQLAGRPESSFTEAIANEELDDIYDGYVNLNCYNLPVGSEVQMTCPKSTDECFLEIPRTKIVVETTKGNPVTFAARFTRMPKGFAAPIHVSFWSNGKQVPQNYDIEIDCVWIPGKEAKSAVLAQPFDIASIQLLVDGPDTVLGSGAATECLAPRKAVRVGRCKTCFRS